MIILVLNCDSSSVKYSLFFMGSEERRLVRGSLECISLPDVRVDSGGLLP
jgi:acetate kinase